MGHKLLEKDGAEMCAALVSIAGAVRNYMDDAELAEAFRACTKKGIKNELEGILIVYADMTPFLFGEKHIKDTMLILSVIEGKTVKEMLKMNGVELLKDAYDAWKEQIEPFFQQLGVTV